MKFSVFYTCYTETRAVDYSIEVLKNIYPEVKIYLVSDGGSDFSFLESKYDHVKTFLENDSRGFIPRIDDSFQDEFMQKKIKESILTFLGRINRSIDYGNEEYLLIMESDVLVRGKISNEENHKLLGTKINFGISKSLRDVLFNYPGAVEINTWGAVPAILHSETFKKAYNNLLNDTELLDNLCLSEKRLANYDLLLPVLFATIGVEETFNPEIVECFRNHEWEHTKHPLVHQYRAKYPTSQEGYDGTHIVNNHGLRDSWLWER